MNRKVGGPQEPVFTSGRCEESVTGWKGTPDPTGRSVYQLRYWNIETLVKTTKFLCSVVASVVIADCIYKVVQM